MTDYQSDKEREERSGMLIAFEGIDGTGKSTQVRKLAEALERRGHEVVVTREPTDGPFGRRIRELYKSRDGISKEEELELFMADRRQHVVEVVEPALQTGKIVITDRYYFSTAAYQGAAGLDPDDILRRNREIAPQPDLVMLLVISPELGIERIRVSRGEELNAFEQESALKKVAAIFERLKEPFIERLDGSRGVEEVHGAVMARVLKFL